MKIRPYRLSQLDLGDFSLAGYSVAGEETLIISPELDCTFDIGKCPREALTVDNVLLSHGHMDHVAGLPYYFAQRDFQGVARAYPHTRPSRSQTRKGCPASAAPMSAAICSSLTGLVAKVTMVVAT